jgi:hypothetical protein
MADQAEALVVIVIKLEELLLRVLGFRDKVMLVVLLYINPAAREAAVERAQ